jgi:hypothetical protein
LREDVSEHADKGGGSIEGHEAERFKIPGRSKKKKRGKKKPKGTGQAKVQRAVEDVEEGEAGKMPDMTDVADAEVDFASGSTK